MSAKRIFTSEQTIANLNSDDFTFLLNIFNEAWILSNTSCSSLELVCIVGKLLISNPFSRQFSDTDCDK